MLATINHSSFMIKLSQIVLVFSLIQRFIVETRRRCRCARWSQSPESRHGEIEKRERERLIHHDDWVQTLAAIRDRKIAISCVKARDRCAAARGGTTPRVNSGMVKLLAVLVISRARYHAANPPSPCTCV